MMENKIIKKKNTTVVDPKQISYAVENSAKVNELVAQTDQIAKDFQATVANVTNGSQSSTNTEIVLARGGETTLDVRLDKSDEKINLNANELLFLNRTKLSPKSNSTYQWSKRAEITLDDTVESGVSNVCLSYFIEDLNMTGERYYANGVVLVSFDKKLTQYTAKIELRQNNINRTISNIYFGNENVCGEIVGNKLYIYIMVNNIFNSVKLTDLTQNRNVSILGEKEPIVQKPSNAIECLKSNDISIYKLLQSQLMFDVTERLLANSGNLNLLTIGDSITYGSDTVSIDKKEGSVITDKGYVSNMTKAGVTWIEHLANNIKSRLSIDVTVDNTGVPGFTTSDWLDNWHKRRNKNYTSIATVMFGWNDLALDTKTFEDNLEKIVQRVLCWGMPLVFISQTRGKGVAFSEASKTQLHVRILKKVAEKYGIFYVEGTNLHENQLSDVLWDDCHFNTLGNKILASRLFSIFVGRTLLKTNDCNVKFEKILTPLEIYNNMKRGTNTTIQSTSSGWGGADQADINNKYCIVLNPNTQVVYSFYCDEYNTVAVPYFAGAGQLKLELDLGERQATTNLSNSLGITNRNYIAQPQLIYDVGASINTLKESNTKGFLHITSRGWHNLTIYNVGTSIIRLDGIHLISYNAFKLLSAI